MPANGFDSLLISARPQFPSGTFALIDWENGRMEFSIGTVRKRWWITAKFNDFKRDGIFRNHGSCVDAQMTKSGAPARHQQLGLLTVHTRAAYLMEKDLDFILGLLRHGFANPQRHP